MKLGSFKTIAHEFVEPTPHVKKIMDEMTADIHRAMFIGMDLGSGDMTATTVIANESTLTVEDIYRAMNMLLKNDSKFPIPPEKRVKVELPTKSKFKSWPYALED